MPTFFKDELNADIIQFTPRLDPVVGRSNSPANGAIWYDSASNSFHGLVNGIVSTIGGASSLGAAINVKSNPYNAVGDGKFFNDGVSNAANNQLTSATAVFAASDVGHTVSCVFNPLSTSVVQALNTTVATFVNSSTITYSGASIGVKAGMYCTITNPLDSPAIVAAFNACKSTLQGSTGAGTSY